MYQGDFIIEVDGEIELLISFNFAGKARSLPFQFSPVKGCTLVGSKPCLQIID
jgi:hypothetical protein